MLRASPRTLCQAASVALGLTAAATPARAACPEEAGRVAADVGRSAVRRDAVPLYLGAVVSLPAFAYSGLDQRARVTAQRDLGGRYDLEPVSVAAPYALPAVAFVSHAALASAGACRGARAALRVTVSVGLAFVAVAALKVSVGRDWPNAGGDPRAPDRLEHPERTRSFSPPSVTRVAWPSGHTAVATAAAASLVASYPEVRWLPWVAYAGATAVGGLMIMGDHHFASDVVSGGLIGLGVGGGGAGGLSVSRGRVTWGARF